MKIYMLTLFSRHELREREREYFDMEDVCFFAKDYDAAKAFSQQCTRKALGEAEECGMSNEAIDETYYYPRLVLDCDRDATQEVIAAVGAFDGMTVPEAARKGSAAFANDNQLKGWGLPSINLNTWHIVYRFLLHFCKPKGFAPTGKAESFLQGWLTVYALPEAVTYIDEYLMRAAREARNGEPKLTIAPCMAKGDVRTCVFPREYFAPRF